MHHQTANSEKRVEHVEDDEEGNFLRAKKGRWRLTESKRARRQKKGSFFGAFGCALAREGGSACSELWRGGEVGRGLGFGHV